MRLEKKSGEVARRPSGLEASDVIYHVRTLHPLCLTNIKGGNSCNSRSNL